MAIPVLVVDANSADGKGIQKSLEATGHFQVTLATRAIEALMRFTETKFHVAVIDFGLPDLNGADLIRQMHGIDESIFVIAVLDEQESHAAELEKLSVGAILNKTAYLSDLPSTLSNFFNLPSPPPIPDIPPPDPEMIKPETELVDDHQADEVQAEEVLVEVPKEEVRSVKGPEVKENPIPPWLQDPVSVKDYLHRLGKEHSAYAWLLSRGATPWNFSETITENQALGIVRLLSEHDQGLQSKGALIRYIRLSGTGNDYLLYATPVVSDINLTLIFSMETPFSVARRQAHKISRLLTEEDPRKPAEQVVPPSSEELLTTSLEDDDPLEPSDWIPGPKSPEPRPETVVRQDLVPALEDIPDPDPVQDTPSFEQKIDVPATPVSEDLSDIKSMPSTPMIEEEPAMPAGLVVEEMPDSVEELEIPAVPVSEEMPAIESIPSTPVAKDEPAMPVELVTEEKPATEVEPDQPAAPVPAEIPVMESVQTSPVAYEEPLTELKQTPEELEVETEAELAPAPSISSTLEVPPIPSDWLPKNPTPASHLPFLDPLPKTPEKITQPDPVNVALQEPKYFLPFTAILLPRFPNHKLVGSLSNQLETWLNDLCIAWGWRIATIDIRPEFLRFTLYLSPDVAPAPSVQGLAQNLSTRILQAFSGLSDDLPSGQFWTKSYLLTAGSDVGKDRLATFIETTRKEQGLTS